MKQRPMDHALCSAQGGLSRRDLLKMGAGSLAAAGLGVPRRVAAQGGAAATLAADPGSYPYTLPELEYPYDALEPQIDAETMELHHQDHHQTYVDNLNEALEPHPELHDYTLTQLLGTLSAIPEDARESVRNDGGGHLNHALWWVWVAPGGLSEPVGELASALDESFGSYRAFQEQFAEAAEGRFGAGWAWLVLTPFGGLQVIDTLNQDSPVTAGLTPLLGLDVWEHAYYLSYRNNRDDYIAAFWNVVNWDAVATGYTQASALHRTG